MYKDFFIKAEKISFLIFGRVRTVVKNRRKRRLPWTPFIYESDWVLQPMVNSMQMFGKQKSVLRPKDQFFGKMVCVFYSSAV